MKDPSNKWQLSVVVLSLGLVVFAIIYATQSYFTYQQVKASSELCYNQGGYPKVVTSGWEMKVFECNFYDEE